MFVVLVFAMLHRIQTLEQVNAIHKEDIRMMRESSERTICWYENLIERKDSLIKELAK